MSYITHYSASAFWPCLIATMFVVCAAVQPKPIGIDRAVIAIGGPLLLTAAVQIVIEIWQLSQRRIGKEKAFSNKLLGSLAVLAGVGLLVLGLLVVHMMDRNLGSRDERGLFNPNIGCIIRLAVVIGILLIFAFAGRSLVRGAQLSQRRFKEGKLAVGGMFTSLTVLLNCGLVMLSWVAAVFLLFLLLYRQ